MDEDEFFYLQPGFDANSLTMPQIRSILLKHDIEYPSGVKKAKLVEIFDTALASQASSILKQHSKVKASSKGIVNAEDYGTIGEPEITPTPRKRASRRTASSVVSSVVTDDDGTTGDEEAVSSMRRASRRATTPKKRNASPVKRGRKSSVRPETTDDEGPAVAVEETPKPRRGRKSLATKTPEPQPVREPTPKLPTPEPPAPEPVAAEDEPAFSSENPFQMGSSPHYRASIDGGRRRSMPNKDTPRKVDSTRRRTEGVPSVRKSPEVATFPTGRSTTPTKRVSMSRFASLTPERKINAVHEDIDRQNAEMERLIFRESENEDYIKQEDDSNLSLDPGEEFTPEEQLEVELEDENANAVTKIARRRTKSTGVGAASIKFLYTLIFVAIVAYGSWWRKEKLEVGYCGIGKPSLRNADFPDWINNLSPQCEPCPPHAICRENLGTECYTDYVLVPHPFSFWGAVPFAPTCQPDSEKIRRVSVLSDAVVKRLRDRAAAIECGTVKVGKEEEEGLLENDIKQTLYAMKSPTLSDAQFNELWDNAVQELERKKEVITTMTSGGDRSFRSTNLSHVPLICSIRKNAISFLYRWKLEFLGSLLLLVAGWKFRSVMQRRRVYSRQVQRLVGLALRRLAQQQQAYYTDKTADIAYVPVNQLRDQILSREFDPEKRQELWAGVGRVVEMNANVRTTKLEHMGEIMRCWTWIGSSALLDMDVGAGAGEDEEEDSEDEKELRSIMGEGDKKKDLVKSRDDLAPRILY
ncbi:inner nuclear membrane protein enriched at telomere/subtelomere region [Orbilia brochopaga]|uniref:Inner nuclear membrane protein enriched at telomere/subtelomere region n=1 Tax=Orbilia brochopaga TaxID=3140254 RepID=A0AAV9VGF1_9PEZI